MDETAGRFDRGCLCLYDEVEPVPYDAAAGLAYIKEAVAGMVNPEPNRRQRHRQRLGLVQRRSSCPARHQPGGRGRRRRTSNATPTRRRVGGHAPVGAPAGASTAARRCAMPEDVQLMILSRLADHDVVALLACRKAPCFSEQTCSQLVTLHPPHAQPSSGRFEWPSTKTYAFDAPGPEPCPFRELRRRTYQRGVTCQYGLRSDPYNGRMDLGLTRWTSLDVPGDTVIVTEVTSRISKAGPLWRDHMPPYLYKVHRDCAREDAHRVWFDGKPRWFPPLVRVTEQGNPTDGSVGEFVSKYRPCSGVQRCV